MRLRTIVGALSFGALIVAPTLAEASSHREAPFVSKNPKIDGTDFYAFESYEAGHTGMVTLIANYQPLQDAYGAPNYWPLDPDALYEIEIDNNGDGVEDWTFQFQFQVNMGGTGNSGIALDIGPSGGTKSVAVPLYNVGLIPNTDLNGNSGSLNILETYTVGVVQGPRRANAATLFSNPSGGTSFNAPADNVGNKSFGTVSGGLATPKTPSNYAAYANSFINSGLTMPGCSAADKDKIQVFVGQRAESFAVNLGPIFDLIDAPAALVTAGGTAADYNAVPNPIAKKNITTIAIEVPRDCIWQSATQPIIGTWTTAAVRQARVVNPSGTFAQPSHEGGAWTTVSRLGNPLVNEVVIGLPDKDFWNGSEPVNDVTNFATYVEYPTLPKIIDVVYGTSFQPTVFPRTDLVGAFLTGIAPINAFSQSDGGAKVVPAEYIHLNTNTEGLLGELGFTGATPTPYATTGTQTQSRLGAAGCVVKGAIDPGTPAAPNKACDPFGFPNGRRPIDDVVDIALDVVEGYLLPAGATNPANYALLTDGVDQAQTPFLDTFPYLNTPTPGANGDGT